LPETTVSSSRPFIFGGPSLIGRTDCCSCTCTPGSSAKPGIVAAYTSIRFEVWAKQLELLREAVPPARLVAVLVNPGNPGHVIGQATLKAAALPMNVALQFRSTTAWQLGQAAAPCDRQPEARSSFGQGIGLAIS
jgi:hypothetical protein